MERNFSQSTDARKSVYVVLGTLGVTVFLGIFFMRRITENAAGAGRLRDSYVIQSTIHQPLLVRMARHSQAVRKLEGLKAMAPAAWMARAVRLFGEIPRPSEFKLSMTNMYDDHLSLVIRDNIIETISYIDGRSIQQARAQKNRGLEIPTFQILLPGKVFSVIQKKDVRAMLQKLPANAQERIIRARLPMDYSLEAKTIAPDDPDRIQIIIYAASPSALAHWETLRENAILDWGAVQD